jgi:hypothetical protein
MGGGVGSVGVELGDEPPWRSLQSSVLRSHLSPRLGKGIDSWGRKAVVAHSWSLTGEGGILQLRSASGEDVVGTGKGWPCLMPPDTTT